MTSKGFTAKQTVFSYENKRRRGGRAPAKRERNESYNFFLVLGFSCFHTRLFRSSPPPGTGRRVRAVIFTLLFFFSGGGRHTPRLSDAPHTPHGRVSRTFPVLFFSVRSRRRRAKVKNTEKKKNRRAISFIGSRATRGGPKPRRQRCARARIARTGFRTGNSPRNGGRIVILVLRQRRTAVAGPMDAQTWGRRRFPVVPVRTPK